MKKSLTLLFLCGLVLAGCGGWSTSALNPGNWFGNSRSAPVEPVDADPVNPLLPKTTGSSLFRRPDAVDVSVPIASVTELRVEPTLSGAIIHATGVATRQGAFAAELRRVTTPEESEQGILALSFRVVYPEDATPVGSEFSRTINSAYSVNRKELRGIRTIRVSGRENARETRRR